MWPFFRCVPPRALDNIYQVGIRQRCYLPITFESIHSLPLSKPKAPTPTCFSADTCLNFFPQSNTASSAIDTQLNCFSKMEFEEASLFKLAKLGGLASIFCICVLGSEAWQQLSWSGQSLLLLPFSWLPSALVSGVTYQGFQISRLHLDFGLSKLCQKSVKNSTVFQESGSGPCLLCSIPV